MTILYLYQYFGTPNGGWSTRVYEMCRRWVASGHRVIVVTTPYDKSDIRASKMIELQYFEGIEVIVVNLLQSNRHNRFKRMYHFVVFSFFAVYYSLKLRYDVIIASSGPITVGIPAWLAAKFRHKPMVFEVRDLWPRGAIELGVIKSKSLQKISYWLEGLCYKAARLIVACSEGMAQDIKTRFPEANVSVVPNACDIQLFKNPAGIPVLEGELRDKKIILYAGSLGLMDNCEQIIQAANVLSLRKYDKAQIVIIGSGAERDALQGLLKQYKLENVTFLGLVPKTEVIKWLSIATTSLVVFKNVDVLNTSSPNKFFDSIAAGVPVIQTTQGWIKTVIQRHKIGITVNPNRPEEMADAIISMCEYPEVRDQMAGNAFQVAKEFYDRDHLADKMLKQIQLMRNLS